MRPIDDDLDQRRRVRARWGGDGTTRAEGRIIAYSTRPMVCVETDGGEHLWWSADLTDRIDDQA